MNETRQEKAQRLVDEGRIFNVLVFSYYTKAFVRGQRGLYEPILYNSGGFWCNCAWGAVHSYTSDLCAHALALRLMAERSNP